VHRVFVGLSGGVDSAVSAYLLKKQGYDVVGAFVKGWEPDFLPCTGKEDRLSAMRVAAHLKIPFVTYDLEDEYKREVVDRFVHEYRAGRTPNPDVLCNRMIKFGSFWEKAQADGADFIATGHYARNDKGAMKAGVDAEKDQTYFLWTLTRDDLSHTLFPVGEYRKPQIRELAAEAGLPNAKRPDSQGLCFLGHVDMHAFLKRYIPEKTGDIVSRGGEKLGEHSGVWFYTVGEHAPLPGGHARMYVVRKDVEANTLVVDAEAVPETKAFALTLSDTNWIAGEQYEGEAYARYRYRQSLLPVTVSKSQVTFAEPQLTASGQSCVLYAADTSTVIGGGIIS